MQTYVWEAPVIVDSKCKSTISLLATLWNGLGKAVCALVVVQLRPGCCCDLTRKTRQNGIQISRIRPFINVRVPLGQQL